MAPLLRPVDRRSGGTVSGSPLRASHHSSQRLLQVASFVYPDSFAGRAGRNLSRFADACGAVLCKSHRSVRADSRGMVGWGELLDTVKANFTSQRPGRYYRHRSDPRPGISGFSTGDPAPESRCGRRSQFVESAGGLEGLARFIFRKPDGRPTATAFWMGNILAALLFGLGHLPAYSLLAPLTSVIVVRAVVLNGLLGLAFGYLY